MTRKRGHPRRTPTPPQPSIKNNWTAYPLACEHTDAFMTEGYVETYHGVVRYWRFEGFSNLSSGHISAPWTSLEFIARGRKHRWRWNGRLFTRRYIMRLARLMAASCTRGPDAA